MCARVIILTDDRLLFGYRFNPELVKYFYFDIEQERDSE